MYYYLLYRRTDRRRKADFLWWKRFDEKPTGLEEDAEMFCLKIIESNSTDMGSLIMRETWPEINVLDIGNLTYR